MTEKACDDWKLNDTVNPFTNRKITKTGKKYKELQKLCDKSPKKSLSIKSNKSLCDNWKLNDTVNPFTNRKITKTGKKYKELQKLCDKTPKSPIPSKSNNYNGLGSLCEDWIKNKERDPFTKRKIKIGGPTYIYYAKNCLPLEPILAPPRVVNTPVKHSKIDAITKIINTPESSIVAKYLSDNTDLICKDNKKYLIKLRGSFSIFKIKIDKSMQFSIKKTRLSSVDVSNIMKHGETQEIYFLKIITELVLKEKTQNLLGAYAYSFCKNVEEYIISTPAFENKLKSHIFYDSNKNDDPNIFRSILFQIMSSVMCLQEPYGIYHQQIKSTNFSFKRVKKQGCWKYTIDKEVFYIPNYGWVVELANFGDAISTNYDYYKSGYKHNWERKFYIDSEDVIYHLDQPVEVSSGYKNATYNNGRRQIKVTGNNVKRFPAAVLENDCKDCLSLFTGEERASEKGSYHYGWQCPEIVFNEIINVEDEQYPLARIFLKTFEPFKLFKIRPKTEITNEYNF